MLLTITTTHRPATDLGFVLAKHPGRVQSFDLAWGKAHVFYPEVSDERCTAALLLDVDPVGLVRGKGPGADGPLSQYVNDRPYVASSFLSVAISQVLRSALSGRCRDRPELPEAVWPLEARLDVLPCRGGEGLLRRLFEPLGWSVTAERHPLDPAFPEWGESPYLGVTLRGEGRVADLLTHLCVLVPVLDDDKHYFVGDAEVEKLLVRGAGWLATHPERALITDRYLKRQRHLTRAALLRLSGDEQPDEDAHAVDSARDEETLEQPMSLNERRIDAVCAVLAELGVRRVLDVGCGEGKLLRALLKAGSLDEMAGMDVSIRALERAHDRLDLDRMPAMQRDRIKLFQGSLVYRDARLAGWDAACVIEVVEHLDPWRLSAFEEVLFEHAKPQHIVLTTPNAEYNVRFDGLAAGRMRHADHRFEWTRAELEAWASAVAARHGYALRVLPVGDVDPEVGAPTQMAVFSSLTEVQP